MASIEECVQYLYFSHSTDCRERVSIYIVARVQIKSIGVTLPRFRVTAVATASNPGKVGKPGFLIRFSIII